MLFIYTDDVYVYKCKFKLCINPNKITICVPIYADKALKGLKIFCVNRGLSSVQQKHVELYPT